MMSTLRLARYFNATVTAFAFSCIFSTLQAQTVTIESASASGCYYYSGASKTTITVQVGWTGASNGNTITVSLDGGASTRIIKPQSFYDPGSGSAVAGPIVTPQVVAFEINADGASHSIQATITGGGTSGTVNVIAPTACAPMSCTGTDLGGVTYFDNNANGTRETGELKGIANVTIKAYDKNGNLYTATSDANGRYAFSAANGNSIAAANYPVRLEFTNWPSAVQGYAGPSISGNKTSVRFVNSAACNIDCGAVNPLNYSQAAPPVFSNLYTNGNPLAGGSASTTTAILQHAYDNYSDYNYQVIATAAQVGSVWAHAWNKYKKRLFSAAFLKRHVGLGPLGLGGIYTTDFSNPASPVVSNFLNVSTIGINVGSVLNNAARGLPSDKLTPNADATTFDQVGKVGIGGMDLSDDGNTLYLMNLSDRKVYAIDLTNYLATGTIPTAAQVSSFAVPDPGCASGSFRPFALKVYEGVLYVGMVCDAASGTKSDLTASIKALNLTTNAWSDVFEFPLTYPKGYPSAGKPDITGWFPWTGNISVPYFDGSLILRPTPVLTDIEFDLDGAMSIAFMDRMGHQMGNYNYDNASYDAGGQTDAGGDVLRAFYSNGAYVLENNAKAGPNVGYAPNNNQGPGFGEFYHDDFNVTGGYHTEMATGGLTVVPGSGEIMVGMVDPAVFRGGDVWANGIRVNSSIDGKQLKGKNYYTDPGIASFGKANGMGDIEIAADNISFLEIGNYVWNDADGDGVQDPTESGIQGVAMNLYNTATGSLIKSTTTDANGNYYFSTINGDALQPNTSYTVVAGATQFSSTTGIFTVGANKYSITATNTGQGTNALLNDNNFDEASLTTALGSIPANLPKFVVTTGEVGFVDHSIDLGLTNGSLGNYLWYDDNKNGLQDEAPSRGINGQTVNLLKDDGSGNYVFFATTTTASNGGNPGFYNFQIPVSGNYKVQFPLTVGAYVLTGQNAAAGTDGNSDATAGTALSPVIVMNMLGSGFAKNNPTIDAGYTLICDLTNLTAMPSVCNPVTNHYTLSGAVTFSNPPLGGTMTVQILGGGSQTFNAPFVSPIGYSIAGQFSDGASHTVTATFSDETYCTSTKPYDAPVLCFPKPEPTCSIVTKAGCGLSNGSVQAVVSAGNPPYSYVWNTTPPQNSQVATGLAVGTYTVTVTDVNMQTGTCSVVLTNPSSPSTSCTNSSPGCNLSNGTATANPTGGSGVYTYLWNSFPQQTTKTAFNLPAGSYTVTVTDGNNCTATCSTTLIETSSPIANCTATQPTCLFPSGGKVLATPSGGKVPYNYVWDTNPQQTTQEAIGLSAGTYTVTITDANNCKVTCDATLNAPTNCCLLENLNVTVGDCDSKNTFTNAGDDTYTFTLNPTGLSLGTTYTVNGLPNSPIVATYGAPTTFGPYLISSGVLNITIIDGSLPNCTLVGFVPPPPPCSVCDVNPPILSVVNNICPRRTGTISLVQGCGAGTFIQYSTNNGATWGSTLPLYTTTARTVLARCVNSIDNLCKSANTSVTTAPKKCPSSGNECTLLANATQDPCNNNGTNDDKTDDYYTIQVNASVAFGGSSDRFEVVLGADPLTGLGGNVLNSGGTPYGSPINLGNSKIFKADGVSTYVLIVRDININGCFQVISLGAVEPCSTSETPKSPCFPVPCVPIDLKKN